MIIKHVPMRVVKKSSFSGLINYLTHPQQKQERVGHVQVTHCHQETLDAVFEIEATQALNTRAVSDKTYHLIISFRTGEKPEARVLKAIEERVCQSLGYAQHQRISAVHHDTDNLHIHVAINKIHPQRHTLHEPYYDYKILANIAHKLEIEYGLAADNHDPTKRGAENRARDMEHNTGIESLLGFIQRECQSALKQASNWQEFHQVLTQHGLVLRERGNGFIIVDTHSGLSVKASSVDRNFSKARLETRFGNFEPTTINENDATPKSHYEERPLSNHPHTTALYACYCLEQQQMHTQKRDAIAKLHTQKRRLLEKAQNAYRLKRAAIKLLKSAGTNKRLLYMLAHQSFKKRIQKIHAGVSSQRRQMTQNFQRTAWMDWVKNKAMQGDSEALALLRARESRLAVKGNSIGGNSVNENAAFLTPDSITRKGTIIYRAGTATIRDHGHQFQISENANHEQLLTLLQLSAQRYGNHLALHGSELFKRQIIQLTARNRLNICFADKASEQLRHYLLRLYHREEPTHVYQENIARQKRRRENHSSVTNAGQRFTRSDSSRNAPQWRNPQPHIAKSRPFTTPPSQNQLRNVSQLDVVCNARRSEMLLSTDVRRHLEHTGTQSDNRLRRGGDVAEKSKKNKRKTESKH